MTAIRRVGMSPLGEHEWGLSMRTKINLSVSSSLATVFLFAAFPITAANAQSPSGDRDDTDVIIVVGSSIGVNKGSIESQALPIVALTREDIERSGQFTVGDILRNQPAFTGNNTSDEANSSKSFLDLRGVGANYTLSLIDGSRFSVNGPANVRLIPPDAIERVEVLKAGASAIYGADAVAGVVNFVLRKSYDGVGANARYGIADGYHFQDYSLYFGGNSEKASFFALADYYQNSELSGKDRWDLMNNDHRPTGGTDNRNSSTEAGRIIFSDGRPNMILDLSRFPIGTYSLNPADYVVYNSNYAANNADPCREGVNSRVCRGASAFNPSTRFTALFNGAYNFDSLTTLTGRVSYHRIDVISMSGASTTTVSVPASNPWNPFGVPVTVAWQPRVAPYDKESGRGVSRTDTVEGALNLDHKFNNLWDVAASFNRYHEDYYQSKPAAILLPALYASLASTNPATAINVFCNECNSVDVWNGIRAERRRDTINDLYVGDARVNGTLFDLPAGPVKLAAGVNWRREEYADVFDPLYAAHQLADSATSGSAYLHRSVTAIFGEIRAPLVSGAAGSDDPRLEATIAARYEHYSDFGGTFDPLVSLRGFAIPNTLMLRASWNKSFRAPLLSDIASVQTKSEGRYQDPTLPGSPIVDVQVVSGGNPNLKAEGGETFNVGAVLTPEIVPGLRVSTDIWRLKQTNVIVTPDAQSILLGKVPGVVQRGTGIGSGGENVIVYATLTNVAKRIVEGVDFAINYQAHLPYDFRLSLDFDASYFWKFSADLADGKGEQEQAGSASSVFGPLPDLKWVGSAALTKGPLTGTVQLSYINSYKDPAFGSFTTDKTVPSVVYVDLGMQYKFNGKIGWLKGLTASIGVDNIGNVMPPFIRILNTFSRSLYDIRGRMAHFSLGTNF